MFVSKKKHEKALADVQHNFEVGVRGLRERYGNALAERDAMQKQMHMWRGRCIAATEFINRVATGGALSNIDRDILVGMLNSNDPPT